MIDPSKFSDIDENDPQSVAKFVKKMGREMGEDLGDDFDEALEDAGQDTAGSEPIDMD